MFENYIDQLLQNIPKQDSPYKLDIVFEGGSFNGLYGMGVLLFVQQMEKKGYITINRFSGASVGALGCFKYLTNRMEDAVQQYTLFKKSLRENLNLNVLKDIVDQDIDNLDDELFQQIKKNKLFIAYHDVNKKKKTICNEYSTKEELKQVLLKSCHFPYLVNGQCFLEDSSSCFFDGVLPYIFSEREQTSESRILYISLSHLSKLKSIIFIKNENTIYGRVSEGILDAYQFFLRKKPTRFCSFVNQWHIGDFVYLRFKNLFFIVFCYIMEMSLKVGKKVQPLLIRSSLYNEMIPVFNEIYRDILLYSCF